MIKRQPQGKSFRTGETLAALSCLAICDPPPPKYQWYWNKVPIPNGTEPNLVIAVVHANHAGLYRCQVSNRHDPKLYVWSEPAEVEVVKFPIPGEQVLYCHLIAVNNG